MISKSIIKRSTYERNKKAGKFRVVSESESGAVVVPVEIRGIYENVPNQTGVTVTYEFAEYHATVLARIEAEAKAKNDAAAARIRAAGGKV